MGTAEHFISSGNVYRIETDCFVRNRNTYEIVHDMSAKWFSTYTLIRNRPGIPHTETQLVKFVWGRY